LGVDRFALLFKEIIRKSQPDGLQIHLVALLGFRQMCPAEGLEASQKSFAGAPRNRDREYIPK
jgi:hypothetical protein